jgi:hypothetical protein
MTVSSFALTITWLYGVGRHLTDTALPPSQLHGFTARAVVTSTVFLLSIAAAFFGLLPAALCWLMLLPLGRLLVPLVERTPTVASTRSPKTVGTATLSMTFPEAREGGLDAERLEPHSPI